MSLLDRLLLGLAQLPHPAPRYYRSVREVEQLPKQQRMSVDSLSGLLAARRVPAAEREFFDLARPYADVYVPEGPVSRDELKDYLEDVLGSATKNARDVHRGSITKSPHPSANAVADLVYGRTIPRDKIETVLSFPGVSDEERARISDFVSEYNSFMSPDQYDFDFYDADWLNDVRALSGGSDGNYASPREGEGLAERFRDLKYWIRSRFQPHLPLTQRPPADKWYGEYTLPGLKDYFLTRYRLGDPAVRGLHAQFGPTHIGFEPHFGVNTLYHTRGGTAHVTDAGSIDPVLHIAELQSDPGSAMRMATPRHVWSEALMDPSFPTRREPVDDLLVEFLKPDYDFLRKVADREATAGGREGLRNALAFALFSPRELTRSVKKYYPNGLQRLADETRQLRERIQELDPGFDRINSVYLNNFALFRPRHTPLIGDTAEWTRHALRNELAYALENDFAGMSTASADTVLPYVGGNPKGQRAYYDELVPSLLERLARGYDPQARVVETTIRTPDAQPEWVAAPNTPADKRRAYYLRFTPELRRAVAERGIPYFGLLPFLLGEPVDDRTAQ